MYVKISLNINTQKIIKKIIHHIYNYKIQSISKVFLHFLEKISKFDFFVGDLIECFQHKKDLQQQKTLFLFIYID